MLNVLINFHTNCIDRLKNLRSLTFAKNNIEKNAKECILFKNYKERFECRYIYGDMASGPLSERHGFWSTE